MNVAVLGCGRIGGAIVRDLVGDGGVTVTAVDRSSAVLEGLGALGAVRTQWVDLADPGEVRRIAAAHDLVIGAVPGAMGFETLKRVLEAGKPIVDISFFPEDPFNLDALAKERGVTAVVDCGLAPGLSNLILGHHDAEMVWINRFECLVGGLPRERTLPWEYKAPFSPADVIEEYIRPARCMRDGEVTIMPALSERTLVELPEIGTLEAFRTDGLRTLLRTVRAPDMCEKTLRYPGHAEKIALLRDAGFFGTEPVEVHGQSVRPIDMTSRVLFGQWSLAEGEEDFTVMRVEVEGVENDVEPPVRYRYDLFDQYDPATRTSSMARTTGYTCTAVARLIARNAYAHPGISPPEFIGRDAGCYESVMRDLFARGVVFKETRTSTSRSARVRPT